MAEALLQYVTEQALILVPALYVIGIFLKKTPHIADWGIPWILLILGVTGGIMLTGDIFKGAVQGVLVTGATVLSHQLVKQSLNKKNEDKNEENTP